MPDNASPPVTVSRTINASADHLFSFLCQPANHPGIDGSGMLRKGSAGVVSAVGDVFHMEMHNDEMGDYQMANHVVVFEPNRRIGWEPVLHVASRAQDQDGVGVRNGIRWTFELTPLGPGSTRVAETYDCSRAPDWLRNAVKGGTRWVDSMNATLERLGVALTSEVSVRTLGSLHSANGTGTVRLEDRLDCRAGEVWSALTDPARLAAWYGRVEGDLRPGGNFRLCIEADGWDGTGRIDACEPANRLLVTTRESDESWQAGQGAAPFDETIEATLVADGDQTRLVIEVGGLPLEQIAYYGAGWQIHLENLAAYLAGRERGDVEARWEELVPPYQALAAALLVIPPKQSQ